MADKQIRIAHADGRAYEVSTTAFERLYRDQGFKAVANADGTALEQTRAPRSAKSPRTRSQAARKGAKTRRARAEAAEVAGAIAIDSVAAADDPDDEDDTEP